MDVSISEDIAYFLNDKNQSFLLQNNVDPLEIQDSSSLNVEPILTEYVDGATWTIGEVPVYLNAPIITETEDDNIITTETTLVQSDSAKLNDEASSETLDFSLEIPGKSFLTSSGIYLSNDLLLHLNLQNETDLDKPNDIELVSQSLLKKNAIEDEFLEQEKTSPKNLSRKTTDFIEIVYVHKCKNCGALFERYEDILEHLEQVCLVKAVPKKKIIASPKVQKMSSLLKTDENKMPITKDIYLCGTCENVGYESLEDLREHMLMKHNLIYNIENEKPKSPEKKPSGNEVYFQSIVSKQQAEGKRIKCLIKGCDSRFSKEEVMLRHHKCHVNGDKKKFKCPECDQIFFAWRLCSAHIWKCHKMDVGLFTCAICNTYKAIMPNNLLKHMATHDVAKPFLCSSCGKSFKQLSQLRNHQVSIHKETPETAHWMQKANCTTCNKTFSTPRLLKKHVQAVHNKYKPFICNICGHQCARKAMLELHLRQHTGEKPYKCKVCDYKTGDHNSLRRHCGRHYGTPKYSCPHCSYQCVQSSSYKLHIKRKHPGKDGFYSCQLCNFDTVNEQRYSDHMNEHESVLGNATITQVETVLNNPVVNSTISGQKLVPNIEDDETQPGLFSSDHLEDMTVDTGGITIPAGSEL